MNLFTFLLWLFFGTTPGFLAVALSIVFFVWYRSRPPNIPPGPLGLPYVGYLPFILGRPPHLVFQELGKKYGPIVSTYFARQLVVFINDYDLIRKALVDQGDVFAGRPQELHDGLDEYVNLDLVFSEGHLWREHRRFALSKFRNFGIGKSSLEPAILDEISKFLDELEKLCDQTTDMTDLLSMSVCNNTFILELGKRMEYTDPKFIAAKKAVDDFMRYSGLIQDSFFPWVRNIPGVPYLLEHNARKKSYKKMDDFMREQIKEHRKEYQAGSDNDYINAYFTEQVDRKNSNSSPELFDESCLIANLRILFLAGMETTTTTLRWAILYMIIHPDVQKKVQKEIDEVIGSNRMPSCEDRLRMPYTEAVLLEIQRKGTIAPTAAPHRVTMDIKLAGYSIPADTIVFPNIWAVHHDEKLCPDPNSFRPERFINEEGKVVKPDWIIPFSLGKRFCLGEPLARMELFLYFTTMLQRFTFKSPEGQPLDTEGITTGVRTPKHYETIISVRNKV